MRTLETHLRLTAATMREGLRQMGLDIAQQYGGDPRSIERELMRLVSETLAPVVNKKDGRAATWLIRVRLYHGDDEAPQADSEPDLPPDAGGSWEVQGLPGVAEALQFTCKQFHRDDAAQITGLDNDSLARKIRGLRPTLSRRGGNAVLRVPYTILGEDAWTARVDVQRAGT